MRMILNDKKVRKFPLTDFYYVTVSPLCRAMSLSPMISFISSKAGMPVQ